MSGFKRMAAGILVFCLSSSLFMGESLAAVKKPETRTPISSVSIRVRSNVRADYDVEAASVDITTDSGQYTIGAYTWDAGNKDSWDPGEVPKITVEIHAVSGYYFYKTTGAGKFQIDGAEYSKVKRVNDDETLLLTLKLNPVSGELDITENAEWVGYPLGKASWEPVEFAGAYELKLYRNGEAVQGVPKVNATTYDFYPFMTQAGDYYFKVRAIPKNSDEEKYIVSGDWVSSEETSIDADETYGSDRSDRRNDKLDPSKIGWQKNSEGWWYRNADGSYPANTWKDIDGKRYLFGYDGYILTGWQRKDGNYYYLDSNGAMQIGWLQDNRKWYYLGGDGVMQTGWITVGGNRYYMDPDGSMHKEWLLDNGAWYYFKPEDGTMLRDAYVEGYYVNPDGVWVY